MGPTWFLSAPDELHIGLISLAIRDSMPRISYVNWGSHYIITRVIYTIFFCSTLCRCGTRYVDGTPTCEVTTVTIRYIRPPHNGHISQYLGYEWMTHPFRSMSIGHHIPEIRLFQTLILKGHKSAQYPINSLPFHFTPITPTISEIQFFEIWSWNIQGQGHEWGQWSRSHTIHSIQSMHLLSFHINRTNHSWDMSKIVFDTGNTSEFFNENLSK